MERRHVRKGPPTSSRSLRPSRRDPDQWRSFGERTRRLDRTLTTPFILTSSHCLSPTPHPTLPVGSRWRRVDTLKLANEWERLGGKGTDISRVSSLWRKSHNPNSHYLVHSEDRVGVYKRPRIATGGHSLQYYTQPYTTKQGKLTDTRLGFLFYQDLPKLRQYPSKPLSHPSLGVKPF